MQHVTAFSRPQTVPAVPAVARNPNLWILSSWRDLILYVCTPLLIVPMFLLAQARWSAEDIYLFVAAFGAMGHHLPGMIRAYGDRALFQRFRYRFIFAPIFLVVVCAAFSLWDLKGIVLVAFVWGVWHGMMQTYGFRRSGALVGVYVGLVLAYGGLSLSKSYVGIDAVKRILTGVVTASALLHFYYDGFIWKVREKSTRQSLGITGGTADASTNGFLPGWALHGAKWLAVFVIPLGMLWFAEVHSARGKLDRFASIVADLPTSARAHVNYATELQDAGRTDEASKEFSEAIRLSPASAKAHVNLGSLLTANGQLDEAQKHFEQALRIEPNNAEYHSGYAYLLDQLGRKDEAAVECETAIRLAPSSPQAHYSYGAFLEKYGKPDEAVAQYRQTLQFDPNHLDGQIDLGNLLFESGEIAEAREHFQKASVLNPKLAQPHNYLGKVFMRQGNVSQAIAQFEEALRLHPDFPEAEENLRVARETGAQPP